MYDMNWLSLFSFAVFAFEGVISPLDPTYVAPTPEPAKPLVSFSELAIPEILGDEVSEENILVEETPTPSPTPSATPIPIRSTRKKVMTIALLGDSMTDTLGPDAPHLKKQLQNTYPNTTFVIKNYGVGGKPIDDGLERITNGYSYLGNSYPALFSVSPDVVVIESFAYNPTGDGQGGLDHHWLDLATAVDRIRGAIPGVRIVIAATIAPNAGVFGDGAPGIAFSPEDKVRRTTTIKSYLDTTVKFAKSEHLPLADAFHASMDSSGNGKLMYINGGDHIHYSDSGSSLMGSKIAGSIIANRLLE